MELEPCGYCCGRGYVPTRTHDNYGYPNLGPTRRTCEYCGGTGAVEEGGKLLPAAPDKRTNAEAR
jgi:hypothetical protein